MLDDLKSQLGSSLRNMRSLLNRPIGGGAVKPVRPAREKMSDEQRKRFRRMRRDLYELMEQHSGSRQLMRHLDLVERTLREQGLAAVEALPVRVLSKALTQLEKLVWDWSPVGLAELRSRIAILVKERRGETSHDTRLVDSLELQMTTTPADDLTDVERAAFEEMERSWAGRLPDGVAAALAASKASG